MRTERIPLRLALGGTLVLIIGIGVMFAYRSATEEPLYQGKSITFWLHQLPVTAVLPGRTNRVLRFDQIDSAGRKYGATAESTNVSFGAVRHLSAAGLPYFMTKLHGDDSQLKLLAEKVGSERRIPAIVPFESANMERGQAVTALIALSPLPEPCVDQLRKVSRDPNPRVAASAAYVLSYNKTAQDTNEQDWHFEIVR